jgi:phage repressor protein C with HTH and peptisase S24 domain
MKPTLVSGDYLIATNFLNKFIKKNNLIIFFDKTHSYIIKRVKVISEEKLFLKSDNPINESIFCEAPVERKQPIFLVLLILKKKYLCNIFSLKR